MKEIFRHRDFTLVSQYRDVLEREGISTFIRNENLSSTEVSILEFFPNLCIVNEEDFASALKILKEYEARAAEAMNVEIDCSECGEKNPGTFEVCFSCQEPLVLQPSNQV